jgi:hypothetical protein
VTPLLLSFKIIRTWLRITLNLSKINCQQWTGQTSKVEKKKLDPKVPNIWELGLELYQILPQKKVQLGTKGYAENGEPPNTSTYSFSYHV